MAVAAFFRADCDWEIQPFLRWFRNTGIAIAAKMAMIKITTRSSMRVKPLSLRSFIAWNRWNIQHLPFRPLKPAQGQRRRRPCTSPAPKRLDTPSLLQVTRLARGLRGFASPPLDGFAFNCALLPACSVHIGAQHSRL